MLSARTGSALADGGGGMPYRGALREQQALRAFPIFAPSAHLFGAHVWRSGRRLTPRSTAPPSRAGSQIVGLSLVTRRAPMYVPRAPATGTFAERCRSG